MDTLFDRRGIRIVCVDSEAVPWPVDIDLIATDPPYGKVHRSARRGRTSGGTIVGDADQDKVDRVLAAAWGRIRPHRHGYVFGPERPGLSPVRADLIWDKRYVSGGNHDQAWGRSHEAVWWYGHRYLSEPDSAGQLAARLRRGSVIRVAALRGSARPDGAHPNEKPVELWRWLIESSSLPGDLIVDPFCGGGSSALAAILSGRRYLGVDIDVGWAEQAAKRADALISAIDGAL